MTSAHCGFIGWHQGAKYGGPLTHEPQGPIISGVVIVSKLLCASEGTLVGGDITGCDVIAAVGLGQASDEGCVKYAQLVEAEP